MKPIKVMLVDDHRIVRQGLRSILEPDSRFRVVGEATNGTEALTVVTERQPDVVLLDLKLLPAAQNVASRPTRSTILSWPRHLMRSPMRSVAGVACARVAGSAATIRP